MAERTPLPPLAGFPSVGAVRVALAVAFATIVTAAILIAGAL